MAESYLRQDALAHRGLLRRAGANATDPTVGLCLETPGVQLALRGERADPLFADTVRDVTGAPLPEALTASHGRDAGLLWMGPDEWLVVAGEGADVRRRLEQELAGQHALVSDVSCSRVVLRLSGPRVTDILAKGCSLDLHPRAFPVDRVAQSTLARAHAMLHRLDRDRGFHVYVHRSFADYLYTWLLDAASEYGPIGG